MGTNPGKKRLERDLHEARVNESPAMTCPGAVRVGLGAAASETTAAISVPSSRTRDDLHCCGTGAGAFAGTHANSITRNMLCDVYAEFAV